MAAMKPSTAAKHVAAHNLTLRLTTVTTVNDARWTGGEAQDEGKGATGGSLRRAAPEDWYKKSGQQGGHGLTGGAAVDDLGCQAFKCHDLLKLLLRSL